MVQFRILSGKKAGAAWVARRFPVRIGRAASAHLQLEEEGVWDEHLRLDFKPKEGFVLTRVPNALATVNGEPVEETTLRNGDILGIGALKLQFWLAPIRQRGLWFREWLTWISITAISLGQVGVIYFLLR